MGLYLEIRSLSTLLLLQAAFWTHCIEFIKKNADFVKTNGVAGTLTEIVDTAAYDYLTLVRAGKA